MMQTVKLMIGGREVAMLGFDGAEVQQALTNAWVDRGVPGYRSCSAQERQLLSEFLDWSRRVHTEMMTLQLKALQIALSTMEAEASCLGKE